MTTMKKSTSAVADKLANFPKGYRYGFGTALPRAPKTEFYLAIDDTIRDLVHLLRIHGINTTSACAHEGYVQFEWLQDSDISHIHWLLSSAGMNGYIIRTCLGFPPDGFPYQRGELRLDGWM